MLIKVNGKELEVKVMKRETPQPVVQKHTAGTVPTATPPYGPYPDGGYGPLSYPGIRPEMYSAFQRPFTMARGLGLVKSRIANEKIGIMTGVTSGSGSNAASFCDDPPTPGYLKRCVQNYIWGKFFMKTKLVDIAEAGEYIDYADVEKRVLNLASNPNPFVPDIMTQIDLSNRDGLLLANELFMIGVQLERSLERVLIRGNATLAPANTQLGFIREFAGLERQYITGRADLDTGDLCPGADSTVVNWGTGIDVTVGGSTFIQAMTDLYFEKKSEAERMGFEGIRFQWEMTSKLFRALTYLWACQYYTYRCQTNTGDALNVEGRELRQLQLDMYNGRYLLIDGEPVPVVFTDGINSVKAGGNVWTDDNVFLTPLAWAGGSLLNLQYKEMDNADAMSFAEFGSADGDIFSINNGMFLSTSQRMRFCTEKLFAAKFRLIQDAPFLAGVINTVQYTYSSQYRDPYPGTTYHYDGGVSRWDGNYTVG